MIRFNTVLLLLLFSTLFVFSQNRNNRWLLAQQFFAPDCGVDFLSGEANTFSIWKNVELFATDASICDTSGNLLFYTHGIWIANVNNDILQNSSGFNPGWATDHYEDIGIGIGASQGAFILPKPNSDHLYNIFYISGELLDGGSQTQPLQLRYSEIDMQLDNGLGGISSNKKNLYLVEDTLVWGRLTACKHANGRDWWIITHKWNLNLYYKFLLTPDSIFGPFTQIIGSSIIKDDIWGQACFSPDGSKFCYVNRNYNFDYMNFDRCTGEFSNSVNILLPDSNLSQGCSFSPNSRFLYVNTYTQIFQFDSWENDLASSLILIDTIPFFQKNVPDWFAVEMLAPDNKIYISTYNSTKALHVINNPDSSGQNCNFIRQGLILPTYNVYSIPNTPNYDLGPIQGSSCDTLYFSSVTPSSKSLILRIFPNPVSNSLSLIYSIDYDALFQLFDIFGNSVKSVSLFPCFKRRVLNVSDLPDGIYFGTISEKGRKIWSEKVIVLH